MKPLIFFAGLILITYFAMTTNSHFTLSESKPVFKVDRADFKDGEIVLPDYAHDDTLIVLNSFKLNEAIDNCEGTDGEIDSVLHLYCKPYFTTK